MGRFFCTVALSLLANPALAVPVSLLEYGTAGGQRELAPSATEARVTGDNLVAGNGLTLLTFSTFNFSGWDTASDSSADALAAEDFWTWGFTSSVAFDLTDFSIRLDRSGTGPDDFLIELATNGSGVFSPVLAFDFADTTSGIDFLNIDLSGFDNVTDADFRLTAFNSELSGGTFDLESLGGGSTGVALRVTGEESISVVPVPASLALLLTALAGLGVYRRTAAA